MTSTVANNINPVRQTYQYEWVIENFSVAVQSENIKEPIISPAFTATNCALPYEWQLLLYPKSSNELYEDYSLIYLNNLSSNTEFTAAASYSILDNKNNLVKHFTMDKRTFSVKGTRASTPPNTRSCRWATIVERNIIMKRANNILTADDKLKILCKIILYAISDKEATEEKGKEAEADLLLELSCDFENLINEDDFSDISLNVDGKTVRAHKSILGKRSHVFRAMFTTEMKERRLNKLEIVDIRHEVFLEMLRYMYSGKINGIDAIAAELLAAADKYSLHGLKVLCGKSLCGNLSIDNAVHYLLLANRHGVDNLRSEAMKLIVLHASVIIAKPEFKLLDLDVTREICCALATNNRK